MLTREQTTVGLMHEDMNFLVQQLKVIAYLSVASEVNQNITAAQKELLKWHWRLGHAGFRWVQWMMASPTTRLEGNKESILKVKHPTASLCPLPLCVACQLAKQARKGPEKTNHTKVEEKTRCYDENILNQVEWSPSTNT
jgi:hypothetical protein